MIKLILELLKRERQRAREHERECESESNFLAVAGRLSCVRATIGVLTSQWLFQQNVNTVRMHLDYVRLQHIIQTVIYHSQLTYANR